MQSVKIGRPTLSFTFSAQLGKTLQNYISTYKRTSPSKLESVNVTRTRTRGPVTWDVDVDVDVAVDRVDAVTDTDTDIDTERWGLI